MVNLEEDKKLFYISGLFSISFFLTVLFSALLYSYTKNRIIQVKTKKNQTIKVSLVELPPSKTISKIKKHKKKIKKLKTKKITPKVIVPKKLPPIPTKRKTPSLNSLFAKVDTSKFQNIEGVDEVEESLVTNDVVSRLKGKINSIKLSEHIKKEEVETENNLSGKDQFTLKATEAFKKKSIRLSYKELEIQNVSFDENDKGIYDKFYSQVKLFLYNHWYPSENVAGNSAIVRIALNKNSVFVYYKILVFGKSQEFNDELKAYLESLKGTKASIDLQEDVIFEVKFRAKQ